MKVTKKNPNSFNAICQFIHVTRGIYFLFNNIFFHGSLWALNWSNWYSSQPKGVAKK
jgi:hypothetical protein